MGLTDMVGFAEIIGGVCLFLMLVYRQVKTGARDAWREEAEAQTMRADRLEKEVARLIDVVEALRAENLELREHIDKLIGGARGGTSE
jgi:hypothetical protein